MKYIDYSVRFVINWQSTLSGLNNWGAINFLLSYLVCNLFISYKTWVNRFKKKDKITSYYMRGFRFKVVFDAKFNDWAIHVVPLLRCPEQHVVVNLRFFISTVAGCVKLFYKDKKNYSRERFWFLTFCFWL